MNFKKFLAFSLVEVMISLVIMSIISSAFAPIITKKQHKGKVAVAFAELKMECDKFNYTTQPTLNCSLCYSNKCVICNGNCADDEFKDVKTCKCIKCTTKYGSACKTCNKDVCSSCNAGYPYNKTDHTCSTTPCEEGTYTDGTDKCEDCPKGKYAPNKGSKECTDCPQGTYCPNTKTKTPTACTKGSKCPDTGMRTKTPCPQGTYQDEQGKTTCKDCSSHRYCKDTEMQTSETYKCIAGKEYKGTGAKVETDCTKCPEGKYSNSGYACENCAAGKWSAEGHGGVCTDNCAAGYYCINGVKTPCSAGTYSAAGKSAQSQCSQCSAGYYCPGNGTKNLCSAGKYSNAGSSDINHCTACAAGYYCPGDATKNKCPDGKYSNAGASTLAQCTDCSAGSYCANATKTSCASGKFSLPGANAANQCKYCPEFTGVSHCSACTYVAAPVCTACSSGYHLAGGTCVVDFTSTDFSSSTTWSIPTGVNKIIVTAIGGGYNSNYNINGGFTQVSGESSIDLSSYPGLKGKTIEVKGCSAGGGHGASSGWGCDGGPDTQDHPDGSSKCPKNRGYDWNLRYCVNDMPGAGGNGAKFNCKLYVDPSATKISYGVGTKGASASKVGGTIEYYCMRPGENGDGGGATWVTDGKGNSCYAGGGGGGGGARSRSSADAVGYGKAGTNGGYYEDSSTAGAGGQSGKADASGGYPQYQEGIGLKGYPGGDGKYGKKGVNTSISASYDNFGDYCSAEKNGYLAIKYTGTSVGGNSGKCKQLTITIPSGTTSCTVTVGGVGAASVVTCGSQSVSSDSGSNHSASGTSGGAGYDKNCNNGTFGAGANVGGSAGSGHVFIENATTY